MRRAAVRAPVSQAQWGGARPRPMSWPRCAPSGAWLFDQQSSCFLRPLCLVALLLCLSSFSISRSLSISLSLSIVFRLFLLRLLLFLVIYILIIFFYPALKESVILAMLFPLISFFFQGFSCAISPLSSSLLIDYLLLFLHFFSLYDSLFLCSMVLLSSVFSVSLQGFRLRSFQRPRRADVSKSYSGALASICVGPWW